MRIKGRYTPWSKNTIIITNEELEKATRSLIGKPVKLNFDEVIGVVMDAEYEDGGIDYEAEILDARAGSKYGTLDGNIARDVVFQCLSLVTDENNISLSDTIINEEN